MKSLKFLFLVLLLAPLLSCGNSDDAVLTTPKSQVDVNFGSYTTASIWDIFVPKAYAAVSDLKLCFKRLRFKRADEDTSNVVDSEDNVDFSIGEMVISSTGSELGSVVIPEGTYKRIEFDLENDCASGLSVDLTNGNGSFTSTERITIKFSGTFTADESSETLSLSVQNILNAANTHNGSQSLKDALEGASGSF